MNSFKLVPEMTPDNLFAFVITILRLSVQLFRESFVTGLREPSVF